MSEGSRKGLFPGATAIDEAFTEARFRGMVDATFPILHIASHFQFRPGNERDSFLLIGNDERLTLEQIRRLDLPLGHVDLLTLSACQTAMADGSNARGAEVEGLGVLFMNQGARNVLATLWQVEDGSTARLMYEFYLHRLQHPAHTKARALREAQLLLLRGERNAGALPRSLAHPYFWAPFVLMGNGL